MFGAKGMMQYELHCGNSKELLKTLEDNSIDSIVTDPPYELGFMGKKWDASGIAYDVELWHECLRVLKPGGHLLAFSGSRTYHRMTVAIEDAGFEIRDQIMWLYGSGFPKSHNVGKQENCEEWNGWGTALKPAHEPICVARKPLIGTVAENVLTHGTGGINVDGCRVHGSKESYEYDIKRSGYKDGANHVMKANKDIKFNVPIIKHHDHNTLKYVFRGRWPANIIHDGSAEVLAGFPSDEKQSPARFFYCAKASKKDRDEGLDGFEERDGGHYAQDDWSRQNMGNTPDAMRAKVRNHHPTVKPTDLMRYLCRLVTPPNGVILDPFLGSGSTGKAAIYEGFQFVGFDLSAEYVEISRARIEYAMQKRNEISKQKENTLFED